MKKLKIEIFEKKMKFLKKKSKILKISKKSKNSKILFFVTFQKNGRF